MKKFIKLTNVHRPDKPLWINPDSIAVISITGTFTNVWIADSGDDSPFGVTETPEEIMQLVEMEV